MTVKYFDTVPPSVAMCVLKTGFLFCASEFGSHFLFQFQGIGQVTTFYLRIDQHPQDDAIETNAKTAYDDFVYFSPLPLKNLTLIDEVIPIRRYSDAFKMDNMAPIMGMKIADLTQENTPQIYTMCGRGPRSSLRVLRHGLAVLSPPFLLHRFKVSEMAVSELPGSPNAVWAVRLETSGNC